jgi:hypothetical protein
MNCPYCNKSVHALTGLLELQKFQKHLRRCRKHPDRQSIVTENGKIKKENPPTTLLKALDIRHESGQ